MIESKGAEPVLQSEQHTSFWRLLLVWTGFAVVSSAFLVGAYCSRAGLVAGLIGIAFGATFKVFYMALGSYIGAKEGLAGTLAMRVPFGVNGRFCAAIPMIFATGGWFGVQIGITASAINEILKKLIPGWDVPIEMLYFGLACVVGILAIYGYKVMTSFQSAVVPVMLIILGWVVVTMMRSFNLADLWNFQPADPISLPEAMNILPAAGPALMIAAADTSRYARSSKEAVGACTLANITLFTMTGTLGFLGAILAGLWDPAQVMVKLGMGIVALALLVLASTTSNCMNAYWGGIALSTISTGLKRYPKGIPRPLATFIIASLGMLLAVSGIYTSKGLLNFLIFLGATLGPANGILACEYFIIRRGNHQRVQKEDLDKKEGEYWYTKGWHIPAVVTWVICALFASLLKDVSKYVPAVTSFFVAGILYYALRKIYYLNR
jgi:NCS1 nucleoside transporter family